MSEDDPENKDMPYHQAWLMNADGTRSSTWIPCTCSIGADHDGPRAPR